MPLDDQIADAAKKLVDAITYDDSGVNGRGGNGGLISRETIRSTDELRLLLLARQKNAASERD